MSFLIALGLSLLLTPAARRVGSALGIVDRPGSLKIHQKPISVLGGGAVVAATFGAFAITHDGLPAGLGVGVGLALATGIIDDALHLPPWVRVALLCVAGVALGLELVGLELGLIGIVALVLACANAVNIVDGQDGLAGGLGAIAAVILAVLIGENSGLDGALGFALGGALAGFLLWNRPPARIFLGNGGAYGVGASLAVLAAENVLRAGWRGLLAAGACLGVFACELVFTAARRLRSGKPLAIGDRDHTYDLLADGLQSRTRSTVLFWALGGLTGGIAVAVNALPLSGGVVTVSIATGVAAAVAYLFRRRAIESATSAIQRPGEPPRAP